MVFRKARGGGIEFWEFLQRASEQTRLGNQGLILFAEQVERGAAEFEQTRGTAGALIFLLERIFILRSQSGRCDFSDLKAKQVQLLRISTFVDNEFRFGSDERIPVL